jgi:hypothetical protein
MFLVNTVGRIFTKKCWMFKMIEDSLIKLTSWEWFAVSGGKVCFNFELIFCLRICIKCSIDDSSVTHPRFWRCTRIFCERRGISCVGCAFSRWVPRLPQEMRYLHRKMRVYLQNLGCDTIHWWSGVRGAYNQILNEERRPAQCKELSDETFTYRKPRPIVIVRRSTNSFRGISQRNTLLILTHNQYLTGVRDFFELKKTMIRYWWSL